MDWKKLGKKCLFPPMWVMIVLTIVSTIGLITVFVEKLETHFVSYIIYVMSFYTLMILCIYFSMVFPKHYQEIKQKLYDNKYSNRLITDELFRNHVSLYGTFVINTLYAGVNAILAVRFHTNWFGILAAYYMILSIMRFLLLRYIKGNAIGTNILGEWKRARICAIILTLVNIILSGAILMIMYQDKGFEYYGIFIYVMAMYTFFITTIAIINIIKYRKYKSPIVSITKIITLAAALVSMLSLETAMLTAFGEDTPQEVKRIFVALTGAVISIVILVMSCYMIMRSIIEIKIIKENINEK